MATRRSSILETPILADKKVLCFGLGTDGAHAPLELANCGVGHFALVDRDRLSVGNVVRHPGGISQVARFKVNVVADLNHDKNLDAKVSTYPLDLIFSNQNQFQQFAAESDVVICGTDNRASKLLVNHPCVDADVPAVYGVDFDPFAGSAEIP